MDEAEKRKQLQLYGQRVTEMQHNYLNGLVTIDEAISNTIRGAFDLGLMTGVLEKVQGN